MKKLRYALFALLAIPMITFNSCSDWLDLEPGDGVARTEYWRTKEDVKSALNGIYISMMSSNVTLNLFLWGEMRADMIQSSPTHILTNLENVFSGEISSANSLVSWAGLYKTINQCNTLLKFAPVAQANDKSFSIDLLRQYEAEAIALRSLMYFYLVRTFGDVPLALDAYYTSSQPLTIAKTSQNEILDTLVANLTYAEQYIPYKYSSTDQAVNKGRMTAWALKALLADVYLWKEDYEKCNTKCDEIIKSGQYTLIPVQRDEVIIEGNTELENDTVYHPSESSYKSLYNELYYKGNSVESLFEIQFSKDGLNPFYNYMSSTNGFLATKTEVLSEEIFIPTAKDDNGYFDIREVLSQKQGLIWKYIGVEPGGTERPQEEYSANYIVYRMAEIYLMKAEALTQMGILANNDQTYLAEAREMLEKVRVRANAVEATDLTYGQTVYDGKTMEQFVLEERARELAFEGKRWYDVLRQAKRDNYAGDNLQYLMNLAMSSAPPEKLYIIQTKYKNYKSHYLPIYNDELEANPLLEQNEFYGTK